MFSRTLPLACLALLLAPAASALDSNSWERDVHSTDKYTIDYCAPWSTSDCGSAGVLCTAGAPPQVIDSVLYCADRTSNNGADYASWLVTQWGPHYGLEWADFATWLAYNTGFGLAVDTADGGLDATYMERAAVDGTLCDQVWSFFCGQPVLTALDDTYIDIPDPVTD